MSQAHDMSLYIIRVFMPLLFLALQEELPPGEHYPQAIEVFHCGFDSSCDANFDAWPDGWTRRRGPGYPGYVKIQMQPAATSLDKNALRVDLNGGGAAVFTPPIPVESHFSYVLEVYLRTEGLQYDKAYLSLTFLDSEKYPLATYNSKKMVATNGWKKILLGPIAPPSNKTLSALIGLHVEPHGGEDLNGSIDFAEIWLGRLSRMDLKTNQAYNLIHGPTKVQVTCTVSGSFDRHPDVTFELLDVFGASLARQSSKLAETADSLKAEPPQNASPAAATESEKTLFAAWEPPLPGPGFYKVQAEMKEQATVIQRRELTLAVIQPRRAAAWGEFGWSLPQGGSPIPLAKLTTLLTQAGINWVKYPLWCGEENSDKILDQFLAFGERLDAEGVELVGLLNEPPEPVSELFDRQNAPSAAEIFSLDAKLWSPSLQRVLARLAGAVRWWQLGGDTDASFAMALNFVEKLTQIKKELDRAAPEVNMGIGWNWKDEFPSESPGNKLPWSFVSLSSEPPLTEQDLAARLDAAKDLPQKRWVVLRPLSKTSYPLAVRAEDLVRRMIAAKIHGADAIFCPDPFDADQGLMNKDGTPGELFLPWRTTALELGGAKCLGSMKLPQNIHNLVFARSDDVVMVVWNDKPVEEVFYLSEEVKQVDLWGRNIALERRAHARAIHVDTLPTFVTGLSKPLAHWCLDLALSQAHMTSVFGKVQENALRVDNPFPSEVKGTAAIVVPEDWIVEPKQIALRLTAGQQWQQPFSLTFPYTVQSGRHKIRIDFDIQADRPYKFSVIRELEVGLSDVRVEIKTRLNSNNELEVQQRFVNESAQPVNFRCELYAPQRRRMKIQIQNLGPGEDVQNYRLENGKELLGQTLWLRAEDLEGPRVLNYRFTAEE